MEEKHVLALPYPTQGHVNPMLQFCRRLAFYGGGRIKTTFATTRFIANTFSPSEQPSSSPTSVQFAAISDGFDVGGYTSAASNAHYLESFQSAGSRTLAELIRSLPRVDCLIYDAFIPWALDVAEEMGIPSAAFFTQACTLNYIYYLLHQRRLTLPVDGALSLLTGPADMPSFIGLPGTYPAYFEMVVSQLSNSDRVKTALVNSVEELEPEATFALSKAFPLLLTIGPTIPSTYLDRRVHDDVRYGFNLFASGDAAEVREWLDSKPAKSVVYVSFGSLTEMSAAQMEEVAEGLEAAGYHFLWSVREYAEQQRLNLRRGLVVRWCEQVEVLSHAAVGCFLTHCGWNSTVEALSLGVPMVGMPQWTDQPTDARLVEALWKVGRRVAVDGVTGLVGREEISRIVREVMESEEIRANAAKWSQVAVGAVKPGGSSDVNIRRFIDSLHDPETTPAGKGNEVT